MKKEKLIKIAIILMFVPLIINVIVYFISFINIQIFDFISGYYTPYDSPLSLDKVLHFMLDIVFIPVFMIASILLTLAILFIKEFRKYGIIAVILLVVNCLYLGRFDDYMW